jgi:tetratricopeptide (TPR) repeat protein
VLRGQRLAAALDGKRIKEALERALALDPSLEDAHFGIGLYHYYADVAPAAFKALRWLLLLPGGDRVQGLREMLQARERGELLRGEADYQLHWLYLWYENKPALALALLQGLDARYPTNPVFLRRIAEVQDEYFHDHAASAAAWRALIDRARAQRVEGAPIAIAQLGLGREYEHLGQRDLALAAYDNAIAIAPIDDPDHVRMQAREALRRLRNTGD